jgi:DNA mismatch repair protein MutL
MSPIRILPEILSNKIAAGEVVERPASVVKELMENAMDAESTRVFVEIKKGGRTLIRVSDNGSGMGRDDALLSVERYATSKISREEDLYSIATLGFRGEALPSIASVSEMEIVTRPADSEAGTQIVVEGGRIKKVSEIGAPRGTMVSVHRLFFNTPARRKYLKTEKTELGHISDTLTRMAIAWPSVHFRFLHNGRVLGDWSSAPSPLDRFVDVLGEEVKGRLYPVDQSGSHVTVEGFVGSPGMPRTTSRGLYVFVNGRFVRDRVLDHAIMEGYRGHLMKGQFPVVVICVKLPHDEVDVNVHPTKNAVRFEAPNQVHDTVATAVSETLKRFDRPVWGKTPPTQPQLQKDPQPYRLQPVHGAVSEHRPAPPAPPPPAVASDSTVALWPEKTFSSLRILGQLHNTYIVCESNEGMVLVDQHAAHERVVFDSHKRGYEQSGGATQGLLVPETLELSHREADILNRLLDHLNDMGLKIEPFGGSTYVVKSVPAVLTGKAVKPLLMEILEKAAEIDLATDLNRGIEESLTLMACHGAIRANQKLAPEQMKTLLEQLDDLENPSHCPHGRPTFIVRDWHQVEKDFKRIV